MKSITHAGGSAASAPPDLLIRLSVLNSLLDLHAAGYRLPLPVRWLEAATEAAYAARDRLIGPARLDDLGSVR